MRYVWMISITLISSFLLSGRSRWTVYRSLKSKVLLVLSASPVPFFVKNWFQDPPDCRGQQILLATWRKCENVGGDTWSGPGKNACVEKKCACGHVRAIYTCFSARAAGAWRGSCSPNKLFDHPHQLEITTKCCILVLIKVLFRR